MNVHKTDKRSLPDVVSASVQSLSGRLGEFKRNAFDYITIDEADLSVTDSYQQILDHFKGAKVFGCTATPDRHDKRNIGEVFDNICHRVSIVELIDRGLLTTIRQVGVTIHSIKLADVPIRSTKDGGRDFDPAKLNELLMMDAAVREVVEPTIAEVGDRPTIIFGNRRDHAEKIALFLNEHHAMRRRGEVARYLDGDSSDELRAQTFADFKARKFQFLCNCNLITRGIDLPGLELVYGDVGGAAYKVTARLRYRINDGALRLGYVLDRPEDVHAKAFSELVERVAGAIEPPVFQGTPTT